MHRTIGITRIHRVLKVNAFSKVPYGNPVTSMPPKPQAHHIQKFLPRLREENSKSFVAFLCMVRNVNEKTCAVRVADERLLGGIELSTLLVNY